MKKLIFDVKAAVIDFFADIRFYPVGMIILGESSYQIKGHHEREIMDLLEPGDVLLRRYNHYLGSIFIPGYWSHVAIYVGEDKVIHMLGNGIAKEDILTFMRTDDMVVLRSTDAAMIKGAIIKAQEYFELGIGYDYNFDFVDKSKMSCTELVNTCYESPGFDNRKNKKYILPDDFLNSVFKVVWKK